MDLTTLIVNFLAANPHLAVLITIMSVARSIFKPLCSLVQAYVDSQPNQKERDEWTSIQNSKIFKALAYATDYALSVKLPQANQVSTSVNTSAQKPAA